MPRVDSVANVHYPGVLRTWRTRAQKMAVSTVPTDEEVKAVDCALQSAQSAEDTATLARWRVPWSSIELVRVLGRGSAAEVWLANIDHAVVRQDRRATRLVAGSSASHKFSCAVKRLHRSLLNEESMNHFRLEVRGARDL